MDLIEGMIPLNFQSTEGVAFKATQEGGPADPIDFRRVLRSHKRTESCAIVAQQSDLFSTSQFETTSTEWCLPSTLMRCQREVIASQQIHNFAEKKCWGKTASENTDDERYDAKISSSASRDSEIWGQETELSHTTFAQRNLNTVREESVEESPIPSKKIDNRISFSPQLLFSPHKDYIRTCKQPQAGPDPRVQIAGFARELND